MTGTAHLEIARRDVASMLSRAADQGEQEKAARYERILARLDCAIDRQATKAAGDRCGK